MNREFWLVNRDLGRKLRVIYCLLFVLPVGYLLYVIWALAGETEISRASVSFARQSLKIGVPAATVLSLAAFALISRAMRPIRTITRTAHAFYKELYGEQGEPPTEADEAQSVARYVTDMIVELRRKLNEVDHYARDLDDANKKLMEIAVNDGLTELYNHKYIGHLLAAELQRAQRFRHPLGLIMIDIDSFKIFNDTYGHLLGDQALKDLARLIRHNTRVVDIPARYGGEEFLVLLPEADLADTLAVAERMREAIAVYTFDTGRGDQRTHLTASMGVSAFTGGPGTDRELLARADECLYEAKRTGKNRVCS